MVGEGQRGWGREGLGEREKIQGIEEALGGVRKDIVSVY